MIQFSYFKPATRTMLLASVLLFAAPLPAQEKVKNVIVMIPDGASSSILSLARWYRFGACPADNCQLAIDPHICGLVRTHSSDSPIGDSAPTGSAYATGFLSNTGFVATYPVTSGNEKDLMVIDTTLSYHPLFTILEAAKLQGRSTGLVVTCHFPHATPADFSAHTPNRDDLEGIAKQIVHNRVNLVFGGGLQYLDPTRRQDKLDLFSTLRAKGYTLATTVEQFQALTPADTLTYALFAEKDLPYNLDRNPQEVPSLAELTKKAIQTLSTNPQGFFLMVEGSKIDWAAHTNDPAGIVTEYLAFDDAVKEAMDFALRDGYTAVVIVPDHGNSGISLGNSRSDKDYDVMDIRNLVEPLRNCTSSAVGLAEKLKKNPDSLVQLFTKGTGILPSKEEINQLSESLKSDSTNTLPVQISAIVAAHGYIGFTTHGHTGEDVFLAVYHPANYRPQGIIKNVELNHYLCDIMGIQSLEALTNKYFCQDSLALKGVEWTISLNPCGEALLTIQLNDAGTRSATIVDGTTYVTIREKGETRKIIPLPSLALYVKPIHQFFLPRDLLSLLPRE